MNTTHTQLSPEDLPVSLGVPCGQHAHKDPINGTDVETALYVDSQTHGTFGVDASYVEEHVWVNNPFQPGRILLSDVTREDVIKRDLINDTDVGPQVLNLLALASLYLKLDAENEGYSATEGEPHDGIDLDNLIGDKLVKIMGLADPDEEGGEADDDNPWVQALYRCTSRERAQLAIDAVLALLSPILPSASLYIVIPEMPDVTEWVRDVAQGEQEQQAAEMWLPRRITTDAGWTQEEADRLNALEVGEGVLCMGDCYHSIFRVW